MSRYVTHITAIILLLTGLMGLVDSSTYTAIDVATSVLTWVIIVGSVGRKSNTLILVSTAMLFVLFWATQYEGGESAKELMTFAAWCYICYFYRDKVLPFFTAGLALIQVIYRQNWPYTTFIGEMSMVVLIMYLTISLYARSHVRRRRKSNIQRRSA